MSIVPLDRVTFLGSTRDQAGLLTGLQALGCVHLIDPRQPDLPSAAAHVPVVSDEARAALRYLRGAPIQRRPLKDVPEYDLSELIDEVLEIKETERVLGERREQLIEHERALEPWGNFSRPDWFDTYALRFWLYAVPHHLLGDMPDGGVAWQEVNRDHRFVYIVAVSSTQPGGMPVPPAPVVPAGLFDLREQIEQIDYELEELTFRRARLSAWRNVIQREMAEADDRAAQVWAAKRCVRDHGILLLEGWAPQQSRERLFTFAGSHGLATTVREPGPGDVPPTLLHNPESVAAGADCMTFYRTPPYGSWDPSAVVFISFGLFFAMILADAGYGLVLGLILAVFWRTFGASEDGRRMRGLVAFMVLTSVGYGVLLGSYFGFPPAEGTWLAVLHILNINDQSQQMPLAIAIGGLHIALANLTFAWYLRSSSVALGYAGWAAVIAGGLGVGFGYFGVGPTDILRAIGLVLLGIGAAAVLLFSSPEPFPPKSLVGWLSRLGKGVMQVPRLSNAFGDVLSYLRLFALGLASARLAQTFNDLSRQAGSVEGVGLLFAILVLAVGHALNLALGVMGGVVHGLRLNCIEFFNWGLPDEGYSFRAFARKAPVKAAGGTRPEGR